MTVAPFGREPGGAPLRLRLYVSGNAPNSLSAIRNLNAICEEHLTGPCEIEVVDVITEGLRAVQDRILVTPTLLLVDHPHVRVLGNLSDTARVLATLLPHDRSHART
ncbi:MAG TPA: circadian clock KaiB family protein [Longimicrobium sp.]|jgi:circadian clock protein KaiB|uniref:circadian clock KaiB family protein n=1 Tax=Longimicrobium sp. TaxID=2029185 RepID=UPI002ED9EB97